MRFDLSLTAEEYEFDWADLGMHRDELIGMPGTYVFRDYVGLCMYIGKSRNLWLRLCQHRAGSHVNLTRAYSCTVYFTYDVADADMLETHLINTLEPALNIDKATYPLFIETSSEALTDCELTLRYVDEELECLRREIDLCEHPVDDLSDDELYFTEARLIREHVRLMAERRKLLGMRARLRRRGVREVSPCLPLMKVGKREAGLRAAQTRADIYGDARTWAFKKTTPEVSA
ncbi:GIY-YIG nuclease family protein [Paenibacillus graminis]|nr:GIY-YIG nuclease family protein [Paenibacillus graminis]MEC0167871.1 GIY-YIG nuclease family protein [Paenibacillus graminis]